MDITAYDLQDREKIEIFISCRSLTNRDTFSKSDAFVIMYLKNTKTQKWDKIFKTETINDNLNPDYSKSCIFDYIFEVQQHVRFAIYDNDGPNSNDFIGECVATIGQLVGSKNSTLILDLKNNQNKYGGKIILRAEKVALCNDEIQLRVQGKKLKDLRFFFWEKSSPLFIFYRTNKNENKYPIKVYETEAIQNDLNPQFKQINLKVQKLCNGDHDLPITVECWDNKSCGGQEIIGQATFTLNEILQQNKKEFKFILEKNQTETGILYFQDAKLIKKPQFLDYIRGGIHLNLVCAIDFTGSNGSPSNSDSLHAINLGGQLNQYQSAIQCVGEILLNYDEDKRIPAFGFGAKPKLPHFNSTTTLHCFPLNGYPQTPEVYGIQGIMNAYTEFLKFVDLSGPTYFNPLIQETMRIAKESKEQKENNYYILLILTDGEIHDMEQTLNSLVASSHIPLSIIIVGVGDSEFNNMGVLDGDQGLVDSKGQKAQRDLTQFVPFNMYKNDPGTLAQNVLYELPDQVVQYFQLIGQQPNEIQLQKMSSIKPQNIPQPNQNFGNNLINAGFMENSIKTAQNQNQPTEINYNYPPEQNYIPPQTNNPPAPQ